MIERLLLLHTTLTQICTGRPIDDNATKEELLEPILFYYQNRPQQQQQEQRSGRRRHTFEPSSESIAHAASAVRAQASSWKSAAHPSYSSEYHNDYSNDDDDDDAIQFAGLCLALYNLPQSFRMENDSSDASQPSDKDVDGDDASVTRVVHLQKSLLVFVALGEDEVEDDFSDENCTSRPTSNPLPRILAVAQISKSTELPTSLPRVADDTATPPSLFALPEPAIAVAARARPVVAYAVRRALQRTHAYFCLWRGGGIHARLSSITVNTAPQPNDLVPPSRDVSVVQPDAEPPLAKDVAVDGTSTSYSEGGEGGNSKCLYPGMDEWYHWRRQRHRLSETATRRECDDIQMHLARLQASLPMFALRNDLQVHYGEFCTTMTMANNNGPATTAMATVGRSDMGGGGGCGSIMVNGVLSIPPPMPTYSRDHERHSAPIRVSAWAKEVIQKGVEQLLSDSSPLLEDRYGGASLQPSQLLAVTCFARGQWFMPTLSRSSAHEPFAIRNEAATTTLLGYCMALVQWQMWNQYHPYGLIRIDTGGSGSNVGSTTKTPPRKSTPLKPFALSFVSDDINDPLDQKGSPKRASESGFLLPPPLSFLSALDEANAFCDGRGGQVWAPPISLPIVQSTVRNEDADAPGARFTMSRLAVRICWFCRGDFSFLLVVSRNPVEDSATAYIDLLKDAEDRLTNIVETIEQYASNGGPTGPPVTTKLWQVRGQDIVAFDRQTQSLTLFINSSQSNSGINQNDDSSELWFDCRYHLAAHLSPVATGAINDGMYQIRRRCRANQLDEEAPFEMCTLLSSKQWFYAFAFGSKELYVLLDTALYVTLADVHHAVEQIRTELLYYSEQ